MKKATIYSLFLLVLLTITACSETSTTSYFLVRKNSIQFDDPKELVQRFEKFMVTNSYSCRAFKEESQRLICIGAGPKTVGSITLKILENDVKFLVWGTWYTFPPYKPTVSKHYGTELAMLYGFLKDFDIIEAKMKLDDGTIQDIDLGSLE
jgi:hypothetical protein